MTVPLIDKQGNIVAEIDPEQFPLRMPLKTTVGSKEYFIHVYWEGDTKEVPRSALLNTKSQ